MTKRKAADAPAHVDSPLTKRICPDVLPQLPSISPDLEKLVFTHPSAAPKTSDPTDVAHYDRLEFLGDAYLELIASNMIFDTYPSASAGRMAQLRQQLVQNETLAQYSRAYNFDKKLKINIHPRKIAQTPFTKIYGDVFEAYIGAICRSDSVTGPEVAAKWLKALWDPRWAELQREFPPEVKGMKEELARKIVIPGVKLDYVEERPMTVHKGKGIETHTIGVYLTGWDYTNQHLGSGKANNKVQAGQEAARNALTHPIVEKVTSLKTEYLAQKEKQ